MKTTTIQIPAVNVNADITLTTSETLSGSRKEYTAAVTYKGHHEKTFTSRAAALAWIRSQVGRISLSRSV
jgi:hypothetical protein